MLSPSINWTRTLTNYGPGAAGPLIFSAADEQGLRLLSGTGDGAACSCSSTTPLAGVKGTGQISPVGSSGLMLRASSSRVSFLAVDANLERVPFWMTETKLAWKTIPMVSGANCSWPEQH